MRRVLLALLLLVPLAATAELTPPQPGALPAPANGFVTDLAGVIDPVTEARITAALQAARDDPGTEIAVATLRSRTDFADTGTLEAFATRLFNHWGIGDASRNDGILVLVLVEDREMRIALGAGYDPVWDGRAQRVIDALMLPAFRDGRMAEGIEAGVQGVVDHIARPYREGRALRGTDDMPDIPGAGFPWEVPGFLALVAGWIGWRRRREIAETWRILRPCPGCGARGIGVQTEPLQLPGEDTAGMSRRSLHCPQCGWHRDRTITVPSLRAQARAKARSSSSGFGGGRSSGGGASGRW